jgi:hypothetical protein
MLSTLSFNANGEVVGGSAKFKSSSSSNPFFADAPGDASNVEHQQRKSTTEPDAKDSLDTAQIDMLKGDLQDLEARYAYKTSKCSDSDVLTKSLHLHQQVR